MTQTTSTTKIERDSYIYNTIGGLLMAFQSVIFLFIIMRVGDLVMAGVFTIAYANANLFMNIGKYGMRNYQASDVTESYKFSDYRNSRIVTSAAMMIVGTAYLVYSFATVGYTMDKTLVIFTMCIFKLIDVVEDVYHGEYQRCGRLDVGAKVFAWRMATTIAVFTVSLLFSPNLLLAVTLSTAYTTLFFILSVVLVKAKYHLPHKKTAGSMAASLRLLKECLPLFLSAFLLFYIGNAPKYAIDACMTDEAQAIYGFISMPVFVVGLLASFVYNPIITRMATNWNENRIRAFNKEVLHQIAVIVVITAACVIGSWLIGIPVLSGLYNTDLSPYLTDLIILVAGGGFYALIGLLIMIITVMRKQNLLTGGFAATAIVAALLSPIAVEYFGIRGASWEYFILMGLLAVVFLVITKWVTNTQASILAQRLQ